MERTEATIELTPNPQLQERAEQALPPEGLEQLERVDAMLGEHPYAMRCPAFVTCDCMCNSLRPISMTNRSSSWFTPP